MRFPYGISDFKKIITQDFFYCDRTGNIPLLERGEYLLFIRPRRFGKSLLLSTLFNYYDLASADQFETLFGHLEIGKNPTPLHNQYYVLQWDFSCIDPSGSVDDIRRALHDHINSCIESFTLYYQDYIQNKVRIDWKNALNSIHSLVAVADKSGHPIYLLLDEYDNFANEVMMGARHDKKRQYEALVFEEGPLRTLFKAIKASTSHSMFDRIFITGVSPVVMSDITSGYNIAENMYLHPGLNSICGFTHQEVVHGLKTIQESCNLDSSDLEQAASQMLTWYNGYTFAPEAETLVYNPTMVLYFLKTYQEFCSYPRKMADSNLSTDQAKLEYIAHIPGGGQLLLDLLQEGYQVEISDLEDRFGMRDMLRDQSKDSTFMVSLLYYFGILSFAGRTAKGKLAFRVPNLVVRKLYVEQICDLLLPNPRERDQGRTAAEQLFQEGDIAPLCDFIEQNYFRVFQNADYRWANELTVKTAFLTLLYEDSLYVMDSEPELERRRADLTMIIRPDMRKYTILDILIEFKFVSLKQAGVSAEQARKLGHQELEVLPEMAQALEQAKEQARDYAHVLRARHQDLRLRVYAVVSLGFERLCWAKVD